MLTTVAGTVTTVMNSEAAAQELIVDVDGVLHRAIHYPPIAGAVSVGDCVLLNTTAQELALGTGGYDFVMANLTTAGSGSGGSCISDGHIIKARYLPCQLSVLTLEEQSQYAAVWDRNLDGMPVLAGQLHSQIIPAAAGLRAAGYANVVYVMTDAAALPIAFSRAVRSAVAGGLIAASITCGQAFGGHYETVTLHSALLAAKHILSADAVIVCQGPGNAGTGTRTGFSGIEQASILDTVAALAGRPIAVVRMSSGDARERHQGISHHTLTSLRLVHSRCVVPSPAGTDTSSVPDRHEILSIDGSDEVLGRLSASNYPLSTMGRSIDTDRVFFLAAVAAGLAAASGIQNSSDDTGK